MSKPTDLNELANAFLNAAIRALTDNRDVEMAHKALIAYQAVRCEQRSDARDAMFARKNEASK